MSTNRNISTLPLDALRSVTPPRDTTTQQQRLRSLGRDTKPDHSFDRSATTSNAQRSFHTNNIGATNLQLYIENKKLRRCLTLFLENSELKTMNALSSVMSMCDDKLRNFVTDKLTDTPTKATTSGVSTSAHPSPAQRYKQPNEDTIVSNSYGKSFRDLDLNDLRSSTFQDSPIRSTKTTSPRRGYSPAFSTGSLRPPMRFGVGKSPYQKSPGKSPVRSLFSAQSQHSSGHSDYSKHISSSRPLSSSNTQNMRSTSKETKSQADDTLSTGLYNKSIYKRPSSAPSPRLKLVFNSPQFKTSKGSAFSPVKSAERCRYCGVQISPPCYCHSPWAKDTGTITTENMGMSLPKYVNDNAQSPSIRQNQTPSSNYQTVQHSLYDSIAANLDSFFDKNQSKPPPTATERTAKRHLAKSVNFTEAPQEREVKSQYSKNVGRDENVMADANEAYNRSTQTTFANNTINNNSPMDEQQMVGFRRVGMPKATSTPLPSPNRTRATSTQDRGFGGENNPWSQTDNLNAGCGLSELCECNEGALISPYDNEEALQQYQLQENKDFRRNKTAVNSQVHEVHNTNIIEQQLSPVDMSAAALTSKAKQLSSESLADIMGIRGRGASEKAKYILHRPVDILIGYYPKITEEVGIILARSKPNKRLVGEIAFQLDRRMLEFVFATSNDEPYAKRRSRYYGYSVASIMMLIAKEVRHADNNPEVDLNLRMRLEHLLETLQRLSYDIERHSEFTQDMVNKYGLLNGTPAPCTVEDIGLREPAVLRVLLGQILTDAQELEDMLIILDCLHYLAHKDKGSLFIW